MRKSICLLFFFGVNTILAHDTVHFTKALIVSSNSIQKIMMHEALRKSLMQMIKILFVMELLKKRLITTWFLFLAQAEAKKKTKQILIKPFMTRKVGITGAMVQ